MEEVATELAMEGFKRNAVVDDSVSMTETLIIINRQGRVLREML